MPLKDKPVLRTNPNVSGRVADAQKWMVQETMSYAGAGLMQSRGPKTLTHVMDALMARNGYGRMMAASDLEKAWDKLLGRPKAEMTKIGAVKRGVLNVTVSNSCLLEELRQFRKPELLKALRATSGGASLTDIRFRQGKVDEPDDSSSMPVAVKQRRGSALNDKSKN